VGAVVVEWELWLWSGSWSCGCWRWSYGCGAGAGIVVAGAGAVVVERELWLWSGSCGCGTRARVAGAGVGSTRPQGGKMLTFSFFLFEENNVALQRSVAKPSSYFLVVAQEKTEEGDVSNAVDFFFLFLCSAAA